MPDDDPKNPYPIYNPFETGNINDVRANEFLTQHRAKEANNQREVDNIFSKQQLTAQSATKILEDAANAMRASREGRTNMPLLALGAGMMTAKGNLGEQFGAGLQAMIPQISAQRQDEDAFQAKLAQLGLKRMEVENAPLSDKLAYLKALQTGEQSSIRGLETALIRSNNNPAKTAADQQKLVTRTVSDALAEARKQVDMMAKDMFATNEEREAEVMRRFAENIQIAKAGGLNIPDDLLKQVMPGYVPGKPPVAQPPKPLRPKMGYEATTDEEAEEARKAAGLPPRPGGYMFQPGMSPQQRGKILDEQRKNFDKDSKDWDDQSKVVADSLGNLDRAEQIIRADKNQTLTGPVRGRMPNLSSEAQELKGLFTGAQLHNIPKGQGAVSNLERELFASAGPNMLNDAAANLSMINVQRQILQRDQERRDFLTKYFEVHGTTQGAIRQWERYVNSPAGSFIIRDPKSGKLVENPNRQSWRQFNWDTTGKARGGQFASGGPIHLGSEWG